MTFPSLPAHQSGHDTRRTLPGSIATFLQVFRRERLLPLQMRCPVLTSHQSEALQETFLHSKTTPYLQLKTKKKHMWGFKFLSTFVPLLTFSHRHYRHFLEQTQSIFRPSFHKGEEAQQKVNSGSSYTATWNKQSPKGTISFFHR